MIFIQRNYLVHRFFRGIASSLGLLDLLRVTPLLENEVEYVEHFEVLCDFSRVAVGSFEILSLGVLTQENVVDSFAQPWWGFTSAF